MSRRFAHALLALALLGVAGVTLAQAIEPLPFRDRAEELRFQHLTARLRCPMCQNESLADSNAPIAHDLRGQIFRMMQAGRSDAQIKQYLVARYSDYVLYDPPLAPATWVLWFGPPALLLAGGIALAVAIRRRAARADGEAANARAATDDTGEDW